MDHTNLTLKIGTVQEVSLVAELLELCPREAQAEVGAFMQRVHPQKHGCVRLWQQMQLDSRQNGTA